MSMIVVEQVLGPTTVAAVGEITFPDGLIDRATVVISGLSSETISITGNVHASTYTAALRFIDLNTGAVAGAAALGNGSYALKDMVLKSLKFTKSATTDTVTITVLLKNNF